MKLQELTEKQNRIKAFISYSQKSIIVAEINHKCVTVDFLNGFDNAFLCNINNYDSYIDEIKNTNFNCVVLYGFWEKYHDLEKISSEINYARDSYNETDKNLILVLSSCVVEYIMYYAPSIWSCVTIHEVFGVTVRAPFNFLWLFEEDSIFHKNKRRYSHMDANNLFCDKLNCQEFRQYDCFSCFKNADFSKCKFLDSTDKDTMLMSMSRLLDLGEFFFEKGYQEDISEAFIIYDHIKNVSICNNLDSFLVSAYIGLAKSFYKFKKFDQSTTYYLLALNIEKDLFSKNKIKNDYSISLYGHCESTRTIYKYLKDAEKFFLDKYEYDIFATIEYNIAIYYYFEENITCSLDYVEKILGLNCISEQIKLRALILKSFLLISVGNYGQNLSKISNTIEQYSDVELYDFNEIHFEKLFLEAYRNFSRGTYGTSLKLLDKASKLLRKYEIRNESRNFCVLYLRILNLIYWDKRDSLRRERYRIAKYYKNMISVNQLNECLKLIYASK